MLFPLLLSSCFTTAAVVGGIMDSKRKNEEAKQNKVIPKKEDFIVKSNLGHSLKIEIEYSLKYINGGINGCTASYICTNIGEIELYEYQRFRDDDLKKYGIIRPKNETSIIGEAYVNSPDIIFIIETSDGKKIEKEEHVFNLIKPGFSTTAERIDFNVSNSNDRFCTKIYPSRVEYSIQWQ